MMIQIVRIGQFSEPRSSSEKENSVAIFPYKHTLQNNDNSLYILKLLV